MGTRKETQAVIQPYDFTELKGESSKKVEDFVLKDFAKITPQAAKVIESTIRKEREYASQSMFKISSVVKEHRGIVKQEEDDYKKRVEDEVNRRLSLIQDEAFRKGHDEGAKAGQEQAYSESLVEYEERIKLLEEFVNGINQYKVDLCKNQRDDVFKMVKLLTKWIILREIKNDQYIVDLFEKLILELQTKTNLLVKVNAESFERMPEVLQMIEAKLGKLTNVRMEVDPDLTEVGLIIESENGIVDGSIQAQFTNLDKLFLSVGVDNGEEGTNG